MSPALSRKSLHLLSVAGVWASGARVLPGIVARAGSLNGRLVQGV